MYLVIAGIIVGSMLVVAALFRLVLRSAGAISPDRTWLDEFSVEKYRPMLRLLSEGDFEYLAMQSGFTPEIARRLRIERRRIFRAYLANLVRDFNRLHSAARELVSQSPEDRSDLASALFKNQVAFFAGILAVHGRLMLHTFGVGTVDPRGVLNRLEGFRAEIAANAAAPASMFA